MKGFTKSLIVASIVGAVGTGTLATGTIANAESGNDSKGPRSGLVDKLATTFNLNKGEVRDVVDEFHANRKADHQKHMSERLQALVDDGTITADQMAAIETKLQKLQDERVATHNAEGELDHASRKKVHEERRAELEAWADEQGINLDNLKGVFGGSHHGHRGPGHNVE